jgi:hypothetical protein
LKPTLPQTAERQRAVNELYFTNFGRLIFEALDSNKHLTQPDAHECVSRLAGKLQIYPDRLKLTDDAFCRWAANALEAAVFVCALRNESEPFVYKAIHNVLAMCDGLGVHYRTMHELGTADEIASDVWLWMLTHVDELRTPGSAKLTTRMFERARWTARQWKTRQLRDRAKYAPLDAAERIEDDGRPKLRPIILGPGDEFAYDPAPEYTDHSDLAPYDKVIAQ